MPVRSYEGDGPDEDHYAPHKLFRMAEQAIEEGEWGKSRAFSQLAIAKTLRLERVF